MDSRVYNRYKGISSAPYTIFSHLMKNDEDLFKLLKYEIDPLSKANLSSKEKRAMIYQGGDGSSDCHIFFQESTEETITVATTQLRIFIAGTIPGDLSGLVTYGFEIITHSKINWLPEECCNRVDLISEHIYQLIGKEIGGIGTLEFNYKKHHAQDVMKANKYNTKDYMGITIYMSALYSKLEEDGEDL